MRKGSYFAASFWDSPIWQTLKGSAREITCGSICILRMVRTRKFPGSTGSRSDMIAEDIGLDPESSARIVDDLVNIGWCDFEPPIIWIRGAGNICDQLGTRDFRRNERWLTATEKHVERLPLQSSRSGVLRVSPDLDAARAVRGA
jgi:hypothetical protein